MEPMIQCVLAAWAAPELPAAAIPMAFRIWGVFLSAFGPWGRLLPLRLRLGIAAVLAMVMSLGARPGSGGALEPREEPFSALLVAGSELIAGGALGWSCLLVLAAVRAAARLMTELIGLTSGAMLGAEAAEEPSPLERLHSLLALFIFFALDLHHVLIRSLAESFVWAPPGRLDAALLAELVGRLALETAPQLALAAVTLALPVLVVMLLASLAQGLLGRVLPETELVVLGMPLRVLLGIGVAAAALPAGAALMRAFYEQALLDGREVLRGLGV
jgi:flagellar biosynthesis protein FliR